MQSTAVARRITRPGLGARHTVHAGGTIASLTITLMLAVLVLAPSALASTRSFAEPTWSPISITPTPSAAVGGDPVALATGDFNSDGNPDIAVADNSGNDVEILLGNGQGGLTLAPQDSTQVAALPVAIVAGDFTNTGHVGLAVRSSRQPKGRLGFCLDATAYATLQVAAFRCSRSGSGCGRLAPKPT